MKVNIRRAQTENELREAKRAAADIFASMVNANLEAETVVIQHQKDEAQKELKTAQSGFLAKIFQPGKFKKEEADKLKESYEAGVKETIDGVVKASGLKWNRREPTAESIGQNFRMTWDSNKTLAKELKDKESLISKKDAEIKELNVKVTKLTEEVNGLRYRLTFIDEDAVQKLRNARIAEKTRADKAERELGNLRSVHENLSMQWNALWKEPEFNEAARKVKERKEHEARLAAEAKREADARLARYNGVLDKFISEGYKSQREFALSDRCGDFNRQEALSVYYTIVALAQKLGISLDNNSGIKSVTTQFLDKCNWSGMSQSRKDNCRSWTNLFTAREVDFPESIISNFCAFVDHMSCSAETYVSLSVVPMDVQISSRTGMALKSKVLAHQRKKTKECLLNGFTIFIINFVSKM